MNWMRKRVKEGGIQGVISLPVSSLPPPSSFPPSPLRCGCFAGTITNWHFIMGRATGADGPRPNKWCWGRGCRPASESVCFQPRSVALHRISKPHTNEKKSYIKDSSPPPPPSFKKKHIYQQWGMVGEALIEVWGGSTVLSALIPLGKERALHLSGSLSYTQKAS